MPYPKIPLEKLGKVSQGLTLHRYRSEEGEEKSVIGVKDLEQLQIREVTAKVRLDTATIGRYYLNANDVVISVRGAIDKAAVVTPEVEGSLAGQNVAFFRPYKDNELDSRYLVILLRTQEVALSLLRLSAGSSPIRALRISQLKAIEIPFPDLPTQKKIAELFLATEQATQVATEMIEVRQDLAKMALLKILQNDIYVP